MFRLRINQTCFGVLERAAERDRAIGPVRYWREARVRCTTPGPFLVAHPVTHVDSNRTSAIRPSDRILLGLVISWPPHSFEVRPFSTSVTHMLSGASKTV